MKQHSLRGWLLLIASNVIFAGAYVSGKLALENLTPVTLNLLRFSISALVLSPALYLARRQFRSARRRDWLLLATIALCSFFLNKLLEYIGLNLSTASDTALLISSEGIFTAILGWLLLREQATLLQVLALIIGFCGVYLIIEQGWVPAFLQADASHGLRIIGDGLIVLALIFEALASVASKPLTGRFQPLAITAATVLGSLVAWIPLGVFALQSAQFSVTPAVIGGVGYLVIVTSLGYWFWFAGLQIIDAASAAGTLFIQPLVGTLLAFAILHEPISIYTVFGGLLIVTSVMLISRPQSGHMAHQIDSLQQEGDRVHSSI